MPRKNHSRGRRPQARRRQDGTTFKRLPPAAPVESLVTPVGKCFRNPRKPKLRFAERDIEAALRQAQAKRQRRGSGHMEDRYYQCPTEQGGCGDYHLTSIPIEQFRENGQAS